MLGKLIKHEFKATYREFLLIYIIGLLIALLIPLTISFNMASPLIILSLLGFGIIIAGVVVMFTTIFKSYNSRIYGDEGYLSITLPVSSGQLLLSKIITNGFWFVITGALISFGVFLSLFISASVAKVDFTFLINFLGKLISEYGFYIILVILAGVVSTIFNVVLIFFCISLSHIFRSKPLGITAGIVSYIGVTWIFTGLSGFFKAILPIEQSFNISVLNPTTGKIAKTISYMSYNELIVDVALIVVFFFAIKWLLDKKLELQ